MEKSLRTTITTYNKISDQYLKDTQSKQPVSEFTSFCSRVTPHGFVLDAGCAGGRDSKELAARNFKVKGIDLSIDLLKIAYIYAHSYIDRCDFLLADVRDLPFSHDFFDGIWCCACLLHLKRFSVSDALTELRRVLKPGGICAILVKKGHGDAFLPYPNSTNQLLRYFTYFQPDELHSICTNTGFTILESTITNERDTQGPRARDQEWIYLLLTK